MTGIFQQIIHVFPKLISNYKSSKLEQSNSETEALVKTNTWRSAQSIENVKRNRMVTDAAMNHWFVCNKGVTNKNAPLVYNPYDTVAKSAGKNISLAHFERIWDTPPTKQNHPPDEFEDFWQDFNHVSRTCEKNAAITNSGAQRILTEECEKRIEASRKHESETNTCEHVPLEELYAHAKDYLYTKQEKNS